ncbi:MAG: hypothetical protein GXY48_14530 [Methanomicrobiales archaeon]|nr:hypothetical protein [Methanomicrobiales archaeon]
MNLIQELSKSISCIVNTHYPDHALRISYKSLLFTRNGRLFFGKTEEVITEKNLSDAFRVQVHIGKRI